MNETAQNIENAENENEQEEINFPVSNTYFGPERLEAASEAIEKAIAAAEEAGIPVVMNFDADKEFPEGYGLAIRVVTQRGSGPIGVVIAAIPTVDTVAAAPNGPEFIAELVNNELATRVVNSVRPRGNEPFGGTMPFTVAEFLSSGRRASGIATFRKLAGAFVKALKKKGIPFMSAGLLEQVLSSRAFAEQQFPYPQDAWVKVIHAMIAQAEQEGLDPAIFYHWLETRDSVEAEVPELDFSDLV